MNKGKYGNKRIRMIRTKRGTQNRQDKFKLQALVNLI